MIPINGSIYTNMGSLTQIIGLSNLNQKKTSCYSIVHYVFALGNGDGAQLKEMASSYGPIWQPTSTHQGWPQTLACDNK